MADQSDLVKKYIDLIEQIKVDSIRRHRERVLSCLCGFCTEVAATMFAWWWYGYKAAIVVVFIIWSYTIMEARRRI